MSDLVSLILGVCVPAQIAQSVVSRVRIVVATLQSFWPHANEHGQHKRMNGVELALEKNILVAFFRRGLTEHFLFQEFALAAHSLDALHSSQVRHCIDALITWHFFPNFAHIYIQKIVMTGTAEPGPLGWRLVTLSVMPFD